MPFAYICRQSGCNALLPRPGRCAEHRLPTRKRRYFENAAVVRADATVCALCGEGPRPDDPFVADHRVARAHGGSDDITNLQAAHKSCNGRKGAGIRW